MIKDIKFYIINNIFDNRFSDKIYLFWKAILDLDQFNSIEWYNKM